jgi:saccharopine dehydrogenase-like NADP-dependent oxidoreductase
MRFVGQCGSKTIAVTIDKSLIFVTGFRAENAEKIKAHFKGFSNRLDIVLVPDIVDPAAYDQALQGVSLVIHAASPLAPEVPFFALL